MKKAWTEAEARLAQTRYEMGRQYYDSTKVALSASKDRQSTPEELVSWLNGRLPTAGEEKVGVPQYKNIGAFQREVVTLGDDKEIRAYAKRKDENGVERRVNVYAFLYGNGVAESSGYESVLDLMPVGDNLLTKSQQREAAEVPEAWDDEWQSPFIPSTSIDNYRITTHWNDEEEE